MFRGGWRRKIPIFENNLTLEKCDFQVFRCPGGAPMKNRINRVHVVYNIEKDFFQEMKDKTSFSSKNKDFFAKNESMFAKNRKCKSS